MLIILLFAGGVVPLVDILIYLLSEWQPWTCAVNNLCDHAGQS